MYHLMFLKGSWEKKLIERVHNVHSSRASKWPSSTCSFGDDEAPCKKGWPAAAKLMSHYPPLFNIDDDIWPKRNKKLLHKEMEKDRAKIKMEMILSLIKQCYAHRHESITSEKEDVTVAHILSNYPAFTLPHTVSPMLLTFIIAWCTCV